MENIKDILSDVLKNYDELQKILRKTEYGIYVGELKSKLNMLYLVRTLRQASPILIRVDSLIFSTDRKISELEEELENAKKNYQRERRNSRQNFFSV